MLQRNQKNTQDDNMQDPLTKLMSQAQEEKTGIEKVKELIEFEYYEEAIVMCNTVLSVNKRDFPHLIQKFRAYIGAKKYDNENVIPIIQELEKAHPQCLKDIEYVEAKYDFLLNTNSFNSAEEFLSVLKSVYGEKNSKYDACIAQLHLKRGQHDDALDIIERGLKLNEYDGLLYELKGDILNQWFNQPEEALTQYKYSMQMNKRNPPLFQKMATLFYNKHFYGDTVQYATVTLEQLRSAKDKTHLTQQQRHSILLRGSSYLYLKEFDEAQSNFQRILDFDEKCIQSRMGKSYACMYKGKSDQAVAVFKKGEELNSVYPDYNSYMALAYFLRKDYDSCEIQLKKYFKKLTSQQEGSPYEVKNVFNLLNYINFFYLDEPYAKASMEKTFSTLDISTFKLSEIDLHFIENLSKYEGIKRNLLEYLQNLMLYLSTNLYRWYPEDLYDFLLKHKENEEVHSKINHIFSKIHANKQSAKKNYQQRIQLYNDKINNNEEPEQPNIVNEIHQNTILEQNQVLQVEQSAAENNKDQVSTQNQQPQINTTVTSVKTIDVKKSDKKDLNNKLNQQSQKDAHSKQINIKESRSNNKSNQPIQNDNLHHHKKQQTNSQENNNKKDNNVTTNVINIQQKQNIQHQKNDSKIEVKQIKIESKNQATQNQQKEIPQKQQNNQIHQKGNAQNSLIQQQVNKNNNISNTTKPNQPQQNTQIINKINDSQSSNNKISTNNNEISSIVKQETPLKNNIINDKKQTPTITPIQTQDSQKQQNDKSDSEKEETNKQNDIQQYENKNIQLTQSFEKSQNNQGTNQLQSKEDKQFNNDELFSLNQIEDEKDEEIIKEEKNKYEQPENILEIDDKQNSGQVENNKNRNVDNVKDISSSQNTNSKEIKQSEIINKQTIQKEQSEQQSDNKSNQESFNNQTQNPDLVTDSACCQIF